jgi:hypothetical protein
MATQKFAVSSPSDYLPSRRGAVHFLYDERLSIPCPTLPSYPLEDTEGASNGSTLTILHAVITPFWFGQSSQQQNQTLQQYQNSWTRARFKMMQAIGAPTMRNQTLSTHFWIVIVDDGTLQEPNMAQDLTRLLTQHNMAQREQGDDLSSQLPNGNAYLLRYRNPQSTISLFSRSLGTTHVGWHDIATDYRTGNMHILVGDQDSWDRAMHLVSSSPKSQNGDTKASILLMETILYVDSGLHHHAIEWMQTIAARYAAIVQQQWSSNRWNLFKIFSQEPKRSGQYYLCGADLIEWHNPDILLLKDSMYTEQGITVGRVGRRLVTEGCPLAGLTSVRMFSPVQALDKNVALTDTSKKLHDLPLCQGTSRSTDCLLRIPFPMPVVVAGKLITDDSTEITRIEDFRNMKPVKEVDGPILMNTTELVWDTLEEYFGIDRYNIWQAAVYLYQHTEEVLLGHPCMCVPSDNSAAGCSAATRGNISELSKYVHLRRTGAPSIKESKLAPLRNAKNQSVHLNASKVEKTLPKSRG